MKILQITPTLHPTISFGGGSIVAWELSCALARKGNQVTIMTTDAGDNGRTNAGRFTESEMAVYRVRNLSNSLAYQFKLFLPLISPNTIRKVVRSSDIVHLHDYRTVIDLMAGQIAIDEGIPVVIQPHNTIRADYLGRKLLKTLVDITMGNRVAYGADAWVALSEVEKEHLIRFGIDQSKIHVLNNGIEMTQFETSMSKTEARRQLGIDGKKKILLYIGRIHPEKDISLLIDCMVNLLREEKDSMFIIAGPDDGALQQLKDKVHGLGMSDNVFFKGIVVGEEKIRLLKAADVFVLSSKREAFPIAPLEACAAGLPVIAANTSDVVAGLNGVCGLAVNRTINDFTEAILKVMRDKDLAERYSQAGGKHASTYSWSNIVTKYIEMYQALM